MLLVHRDEELGHLKAALAECSGIRSRTIVVEGGVGCGKSALLAAFAEYAAEAGTTVLGARGMGADAETHMTVLDQLRVQLPSGIQPEEAAADPAWHLSDALRALSRQGPVVIYVDDAQDTDQASLFGLFQAAGRVPRTLLVFAESLHLPHRDPVIKTELLRQSDSLRIRLGPLDKKGVAEMIDGRIGGWHAGTVVDRIHRISAGNPLLLRALIEECSGRDDAGADAVTEPQPMEGGMYGQAVLTCLYRSGGVALQLGHILAVLGEAATRELLARVSGRPSAQLDRHIQALRGAGIIDGLSYRHQAARATVLADMAPAVREGLHRTAATALYEAGLPSPVVATQLLFGRCGAEPWQRVILRHAAEEALTEDDAGRAIDLLELALENSPDDEQRIEILLRLSLITWRVDPAAVESRYLPELIASMQAGRLSPAAVSALVRLLIAHGRIEDALEALHQQHGAPEAESEITPDVAWMWVRYGFHALEFPDEAPVRAPGAAPDGADARVPGVPRLKSSAETLLTHDPREWVSAAENFLKVTPLTDSTVGPLCSAIKALLFADCLDSAWHWCEQLVKEAQRRRCPGWAAVFAVIQGMVAVRQGSLADALSCIELAQSVLPERTWSVLVCGAHAVLSVIYTEMGALEEATRLFDLPVPADWEKSIYWLGYLRARGCLRLATDRPHAALSDFLRIGKIARRLGIDYPLMVSWCTDAAEAWIRLNEPEQASELLAQQEGKKLPSNGRSRGIALRLKAALAPVADRPRLLGQAVELLHDTGDRLELAKTFADLADAHESAGSPNRADIARRRAWHLARECGAQPLCRRLERDGRIGALAARERSVLKDEEPTAPAPGKVTRAERRVAELAARGHSNREISQRLNITISTVEQHLTRVYQKLHISRRDQIPVGL
ncbi:helix-turn-helix transcriptional regulator [Streptomyces coffeae]|uniref:AAA family ATPase n=1 Tax=Streptomyces coffeae TaxID=621382 RepID=A0ABS1NRB0_9ACTN|nr:LuxR family transcriptional regulator [Streptomyces coffeae]MBL1102479.1 AAA family ATPase [Streptomyces coffeae]